MRSHKYLILEKNGEQFGIQADDVYDDDIFVSFYVVIDDVTTALVGKFNLNHIIGYVRVDY